MKKASSLITFGASVALVLASLSGSAHALDTPEEPPGDGGSPTSPPPAPAPAPERASAWYKVQVTLEKFRVNNFDDGPWDFEPELYGTITTRRNGSLTGDTRSMGYVENRYLEECYGINHHTCTDWSVGLDGNDQVDWIKGHMDLYPDSRYRDHWKLTTSGINSYGNAYNNAATRRTNYDLGLANDRLCSGDPQIELSQDPYCTKNNNVVQLWVLNGRGGSVNYNFTDFDPDAVIFGGGDDHVCHDKIDLGDSSAAFLDEQYRNHTERVIRKSKNKVSGSDGGCEIQLRVRVLSKRDLILEEEVPGPE
ncbi:hypothetical protein [Streptomyces avermitilis]|uniref:hypothetical protein n=1 Tax=Streptomyces avermitilis TaxID=33903 RepID=UPI0037F174CB